VKATIPGPLTIEDTCNNSFYKDRDEFLDHLAKSVNEQLKELLNSGCKYVQIDEPVLARYPQDIERGLRHLKTCLNDLPRDGIEYTVHICKGYKA